MVGLGGVRVYVIEELKFLGKFTKKKFRGVGLGGSGWGGQGGCEVFVKIQKKMRGGPGGVRGSGWGGQDGCERRIEVFVKIQKKKNWGGGPGGGRVGEGSGFM